MQTQTDYTLTMDNIADTLADTHRHDVGLLSEDHYASLPGPIRSLRAFLLPLVHKELKPIKYIQSYHNYWLTLYFLVTANFGSHTFYVIMLPLPAWLGSLNLTRDLVIVLGLGIYFSGAFKDLLCLPRPSSPPLKRLTMSHYTSTEYGCPSSHSANAIAVSTVLWYHIANNDTGLFTPSTKLWLYSGLFLYCLTLVLGRLYCGMHGLVDVTIGGLIGLATVLLRLATKPMYDLIILSNPSLLVPVFVIAMYFAAIYYHPTPIEPCPCFEDSIAFMGVLLGLDVGYWSFTFREGFRNYVPLEKLYQIHPSRAFFPNNNTITIFSSLLRLLIGVLLVFIWRSVAKPFFTNLICKLRNESSSTFKKQSIYVFMSRTDTRIIVKYIVYSGIAIVTLYAKYLFEVFNV